MRSLSNFLTGDAIWKVVMQFYKSSLGRILGVFLGAAVCVFQLADALADDPQDIRWKGTLTTEDGDALDVVLTVSNNQPASNSVQIEGGWDFGVKDIEHRGLILTFTLETTDANYRCTLEQQQETQGYKGPCLGEEKKEMLGRVLLFRLPGTEAPER